MLLSFTQLLFQRSVIMAFNSRSAILLIQGIQNYSRPFDEIVYSYDSTTTKNDNLCLGSTSTKNIYT
jgi:hypothetical protein